MNTSSPSFPIHQCRIGRIVAAIWENQTERGVRHNVTLSKIYKRSDSSDWSRTETFSRDDLPVVEKVAALAFSWIHEQSPAKEEAAAK